MTWAEHVLRDYGVPYTILRVGALFPNPCQPMFDWAIGRACLTTDLKKFGGVMRADLDEQILGSMRARRCMNRIFVIDDPTLKPQVDHFLCKRAQETDTVKGTRRNAATCPTSPTHTRRRVRGERPAPGPASSARRHRRGRSRHRRERCT